MSEPKPISMTDAVRYLILVMRRMATKREFGEIRISIQGGQIATIQEQRSYRGGVPLHGSQEDIAAATNAARQLVG